jgi:penicillin-binding protein 1A
LVRYLGLDKTLECLRKYSFGESLLPENLSVALGTGTTNPLDFVENYSIFTNKGNLIESHIIDRVEDINGNIVYDPNHKYTSGKIPSVKKVLDERVAFMLADILKDTLYRTSIAKSFDLPLENLGGKSGTTNNSTSTWYAGFAGDMIIAVWVGKDNFSSLGDEEFGGTIALPIWLDFLSHSKDSIVDKPLILPEGVSVVRVNKKTGNISNTFDDSVFEFFLEENLEQLLEEAYKTDFLNVFD